MKLQLSFEPVRISRIPFFCLVILLLRCLMWMTSNFDGFSRHILDAERVFKNVPGTVAASETAAAYRAAQDLSYRQFSPVHRMQQARTPSGKSWERCIGGGEAVLVLCAFYLFGSGAETQKVCTPRRMSIAVWVLAW